MVAVIVVVPGCNAVMVERGFESVPVAMLAIVELLLEKLRVPMDEPQLGTGVRTVLTAASPAQVAVPLVMSAKVGGAVAPTPPFVTAIWVPAGIVFVPVRDTEAVAPDEPLLKLVR